jgi:DNA excision repair protein ERCC-6
MKRDVALMLPKKQEHVLFCRLCPEQRDAYKAFLASKTVRQVLNGKLNPLFAISMLVKLINHVDIATSSPLWEGPRFCNAKAIPADGSSQVEDDEESDVMLDNLDDDYGSYHRSGKMLVVNKVLEAWHRDGSRALVFSQSRAVIKILVAFARKRGYSFRQMDGTTPVGTRMQLIDEYNVDNNIFLFFLTSKVGGLGVNLTGADRVLLFDAHWNPSVDAQASERAWRIGQTKPVTVYRLITAGTLEEKIYQRQLLKQFLSNKVLSDPKQRRFFKKKQMRDLFTLADDSEDVINTETGLLFGGTSARERVGLPGANVGSGEAFRDKGKCESGGSAGRGDEDDDVCGGARLLQSLFDNPDGTNGLRSAMNHDDVVNAGTASVDVSLMQYEADKVAAIAAAEVARSARARRGNSVSEPTWTGRSGLAGIPRVKTSSLSNVGGVGIGGGLLQRIKNRESGIGSSGVALLQGMAGSEKEGLMQSIVTFLNSCGGEAMSGVVVAKFEGRVGAGRESLAVFKAMLKRAAILKRNCGPNGESVWHLRDVYKD